MREALKGKGNCVFHPINPDRLPHVSRTNRLAHGNTAVQRLKMAKFPIIGMRFYPKRVIAPDILSPISLQPNATKINIYFYRLMSREFYLE